MDFKDQPQIAIITSNSLTGIGLRGIIEKMMPGAVVTLYNTVEELEEQDDGFYFHYFVSSTLLLNHSRFFLPKHNKTIVLVEGNEVLHFPKQLHTLNVCLDEDTLVRSVLKLAETAHRTKKPEVVERAKKIDKTTHLTKRELEVLKLMVKGNKNREIAEILHITLATVITHRKHLISKLHIKAVSGLTIYAVTHGLVTPEEI